VLDTIFKEFKFLFKSSEYPNSCILANEYRDEGPIYIIFNGLFLHEDQTVSNFHRLVLDKSKTQLLTVEEKSEEVGERRPPRRRRSSK